MADTQKKTVDELEKELAELRALSSAKDKIIETLATEKATGYPVVEYEGRKYEIRTQTFQLGKEIYTADDLKNNADLVKQLLDKKSGILKLIEEKKAPKAQ